MMSFFHRFTTLLRADAHGALDALEDRQLLLRQHLREAEEALAAKKARASALEAEERDLRRTVERLQPRLEALDGDITLAIAESRDDLARFALERFLPIERQIEGIGARRRDLAQEKEELAELLEGQEERLEDLRLRVRAALDRVDGPLPAWGASGQPAKEEIELELLRRSTSGLAAEAPS